MRARWTVAKQGASLEWPPVGLKFDGGYLKMKAIQNIGRKMKFYVIGALALTSVVPSYVLAQTAHSHPTDTLQDLTAAQKARQSALIKMVQDATERFKDVAEAEREGYAPNFGCVSGPDQGAMGIHYINGDILGKGEIDVRYPTIVIYEPTPDGHLKLIGADYLVFAAQWDGDKSHKGNPPDLGGQLFHYFEAPNRFHLDPFYSLHVWAWKDNPNGAFVNWHPNVVCQQFQGQTR
jgi:hypothetical protein